MQRAKDNTNLEDIVLGQFLVCRDILLYKADIPTFPWHLQSSQLDTSEAGPNPSDIYDVLDIYFRLHCQLAPGQKLFQYSSNLEYSPLKIA